MNARVLHRIILLVSLVIPTLVVTSSAAPAPTVAQIVTRMNSAINSHLSGTMTTSGQGLLSVLSGDRYGDTSVVTSENASGKVPRLFKATVADVFYLRMDSSALEDVLAQYMAPTAAKKYGARLGGKWLNGGKQTPKVLSMSGWGSGVALLTRALVKTSGKSLVEGKPALLNGQAMFILTGNEGTIYVNERTFLPSKEILKLNIPQITTITYGHVERIIAPPAVTTPRIVTSALTALEVELAKLNSGA